MPATSLAVLSRIPGRRLPDSTGWVNRFEIHSETSSRVYIIAEKVTDGAPSGTWGCSCPGWKGYRNCKHLKTIGLPSCAEPITPRRRPRGLGTGSGAEVALAGSKGLGGASSSSASFSDAAYDHYDPAAEGFGSASEWIRAAEEMAQGRASFTPPAGRRGVPGRVTPDMRLLGITEMPADARDFARAMKRQARVVHPDFGGTKEQFTAMQLAYERMLRRYYPEN